MAKTSLLTIPAGLDITYFKSLQSGDRFTYPHIKVKRLFTSRSRKAGLTQKSLFVQLGPVWAGFSDAVRLAWNNAGAVCDLSGFKLLVQDTAVRMANDISGYASPSILYQSKVGKIAVEIPAIGLTILQLHPQSYYVSKKVTGTRSQYEPKLITEDLSLPVNIGISYKSSFVSASSAVPPSIIDFYSESHTNNDKSVYAGATPMVGQTFTNLNENMYLKSCKFNLKRVGSISGMAYAFLYEISGGVPVGSPVATSGGLNTSSLYTFFALKTFTFSDNFLMQAGKQYAIVLYFNSGNSTNNIGLGVDTSVHSHSGHVVMYAAGWGQTLSQDCSFYVYGLPVFNPYARFFITIYSNYQGLTIENKCVINFSLLHDWDRLTASISAVKGQFRGYTAFIEVHDVQGYILFDNVEITHGGLNWARDPFCNSIQTTFTKMFYQIPKNWSPLAILTGAFYGSVYHE